MSVGGKLLLRFVLLQSIVVGAFSSCICPVAHPQQRFCKHEYVLKIKIDQINSDLSEKFRYDVEIQHVYKGDNNMLTYRGGTVRLKLPTNCTFNDVRTGQIYIIFGRKNKGKLVVRKCSGSGLYMRDLHHLYWSGCKCMKQKRYKNMTFELCKWDFSYVNSNCNWAISSDYNDCRRTLLK